MKLAVGRCPESGAALASQSTICRLENAPRKSEAARLCAALIDQFGKWRVAKHVAPRRNAFCVFTVKTLILAPLRKTKNRY
jgi:hypothetical protein